MTVEPIASGHNLENPKFTVDRTEIINEIFIRLTLEDLKRLLFRRTLIIKTRIVIHGGDLKEVSIQNGI